MAPFVSGGWKALLLLFFLVFLDYFDVLISKMNFKK
jgi:hypothetical protein